MRNGSRSLAVDGCNAFNWCPASIARTWSFPVPASQADSSLLHRWLLTRSVSPPRPSSKAAASARAILDSVGWMKMPSGFDLDLGRVWVDLYGWERRLRGLIVTRTGFSKLWHCRRNQIAYWDLGGFGRFSSSTKNWAVERVKICK